MAADVAAEAALISPGRTAWPVIIAAPTHQQEVLGYDLRGVVVHTLLVDLFASLKLAFHIQLVTFVAVMRDNFSRFAPENHTGPFCFLLLFAGLLVTPDFAGGKRKVSHGIPGSQGARFRILPQVAQQDDFLTPRLAMMVSRLEKRLQLLGVPTTLDLARTSPSFTRKNFGVVLERTVRELNGESCISMEERPRLNSRLS